MAVCTGSSLLGLSSGLGAMEVFSCKESVDFIFKDLHSVSQDLGFGDSLMQL